jgi:hypothetical protein
MPNDEKMYKLLLDCWTVAYEKTIVEEQGKLAKKMFDQACCNAVEDLTQRLLNADYITAEDIVGNRFDTMEEAIKHHSNNLKKGDVVNKEQKLNIYERTENGEKVVEITVDNCTYQEGCKWALDESVFNPKEGLYRCQRLGCFVGAVKKYMKSEKFLKLEDENKTNEEKKELAEARLEKLSYLMTSVIESTEEDGIKCRCKGFVFVIEPAIRAILIDKYLLNAE